MSNNPSYFKDLRNAAGRFASRLGRLLPAPDCLLCGAPGASQQLCAGCLADLRKAPSPACPRCALPVPEAGTCGQCLKHPPHYDATLALWTYGAPVDTLIQQLKYGHRLAIAGLIAEQLLAGPRLAGDLLLPVPLAPERLRQRGFNQAVEIGRPLARALGIPLALDACQRLRDTAPQAELPWKQRRRNIRHAFQGRSDLGGKHVIVLDDVMTTGSTLDELARTLKDHGAASVSNWVVARALKLHP